MPALHKIFVTTSALASLVCVAACSSSSTSKAGSAATSLAAQAKIAATSTAVAGEAASSSAAGEVTPAGPSASTSRAAGSSLDVCATLPAAMAKQLSGEDITSAVPVTELAGSGDFGCGYSNDDSSVQVQVQAFVAHGPSTWQVASTSKNKTPVAGLGDEAFYDNDGTLYARKGKAVVQVNGINSADKCAALAKPILALL